MRSIKCTVTVIPDIQGSVIASLDSGSGALSKIGYLPYGRSASVAAPFGYTGQRIDPESNGLYYYRARQYSPAWGRFLQPDPIGYGGSTHLYAYVNNDPLNSVDPSGLWQVTISGGYSLIGGSVTFGFNSEQWNVGGWLGVGGGLSVRVNPWDAPAATPSGFDASARGQANYNLGSLGGGGFGLTHSFDTGTTTANGSYSLGLGLNVAGTLSSRDDATTGPKITGGTVAPTWGYRERVGSWAGKITCQQHHCTWLA